MPLINSNPFKTVAASGFTVTVGEDATQRGYCSGCGISGTSSMVPNTYLGNLIIDYIHIYGGPAFVVKEFRVVIAGLHAQNFFAQTTITGNTYLTNTLSTYQQQGGNTWWRWNTPPNGAFPVPSWVNGVSYPVTIT